MGGGRQGPFVVIKHFVLPVRARDGDHCVQRSGMRRQPVQAAPVGSLKKQRDSKIGLGWRFLSHEKVRWAALKTESTIEPI